MRASTRCRWPWCAKSWADCCSRGFAECKQRMCDAPDDRLSLRRLPGVEHVKLSPVGLGHDPVCRDRVQRPGAGIPVAIGVCAVQRDPAAMRRRRDRRCGHQHRQQFAHIDRPCANQRPDDQPQLDPARCTGTAPSVPERHRHRCRDGHADQCRDRRTDAASGRRHRCAGEQRQRLHRRDRGTHALRTSRRRWRWRASEQERCRHIEPAGCATTTTCAPAVPGTSLP